MYRDSEYEYASSSWSEDAVNSLWQSANGRVSLVLIALVFLVSLSGCGKTEVSPAEAKITKTLGVVQWKSDSQTTWTTAKVGDRLAIGGCLKTGEEAAASLELPGGHQLHFAQDTFFEYREPAEGVRQAGGKIEYHVIKESGKDFKVRTPHAQTAVLGTTFFVSVLATSTEVALIEGKLRVANLKGDIEKTMISGQKARVLQESIDLSSGTVRETRPGSPPSIPGDQMRNPEPQNNTTPQNASGTIDLHGNQVQDSPGDQSIRKLVEPGKGD